MSHVGLLIHHFFLRLSPSTTRRSCLVHSLELLLLVKIWCCQTTKKGYVSSPTGNDLLISVDLQCLNNPPTSRGSLYRPMLFSYRGIRQRTLASRSSPTSFTSMIPTSGRMSGSPSPHPGTPTYWRTSLPTQYITYGWLPSPWEVRGPVPPLYKCAPLSMVSTKLQGLFPLSSAYK